MQEAYDSYENIILNSSEGDLVNRTVNLSSTALSVQPGDVLGYYVETRGGRLEEGILLERRENGAGENVWYHNGPLKYSPLVQTAERLFFEGNIGLPTGSGFESLTLALLNNFILALYRSNIPHNHTRL